MAGSSSRESPARLPAAILTLAALAWSVFAATRFHPALVSNDGAQYLSIASSIAAGHGNSTSILTYEQHFVAHALPAPQTVFPPGYSYVTALFLGAGLSPEWAGFAASLGCHLLGGAFLFHLLWRGAGVHVRVAAALALAWMLLAVNLSLVADALSEPTYLLATLASTWCYWRSLSAPRFATSWMLASGSLAAAALQVRYAGMFFLAGAGLALAVQWLRAPNLRGVLRIVLWGLPAAAVVAMTFWRNYELLGTIRGGPNILHTHSFGDFLQRFYWAANATLGWGVRGDLVEWLATIAAVAGCGLLLLAKRRTVGAPVARETAGSGWLMQPLTLWSLLYLGVSLALLAWMTAATTAPVSARYLHPLWPFVLLAFAPLFAEGRARHASRLLISTGTFLLCAAFALAQLRLYQNLLPTLIGPQPRTAIDRALAGPHSARTLAACLRRLTADGNPVFTNEPQQVGLSLRVPTLGLPSAEYATKEWNPAAVERLMEQFHVRWALFLPRVYDQQVHARSKQAPFYGQLRAGVIPPGWSLATQGSDHVLFARFDAAMAPAPLPVECSQRAEADFRFGEQPAS